MAIPIKDYEEKPYNLCLNCAHIGRNCDGPNFLAMEVQRLSEWCRLRKEYLHADDPKWTNAYIAERAGLSKVSVDRFLSGNVGDLKASTVAGILRVLVNGTWGKYPCAMGEWADYDVRDLTDKLATATTENKFLQANLDAMKKEYRLDIKMIRDQASEEIAHLKRASEFHEDQLKAKDAQIAEKDKQMGEQAAFMRRKDRIIRVLAFLLAVCIVLLVSGLIADWLSPGRGFFWTR